MNKIVVSLFMLLASIVFNVDVGATTPPVLTNVYTATAVTRVEWPTNANGLNRCVSFTDGGLVSYVISPGYVSVKYWLGPNQGMSFQGLFAPDRHYKWRISGGVLYLRWYGSSLETPYLLHPYGSAPDYAYVLQVTRLDVALTVDGLPGTFVFGGKVPLIPITGGSGDFVFTGPSDMTGTAEANTGLWFRPIRVKKIIP